MKSYNLSYYVDLFKNLKKAYGYTKEEILDCLEFDSDENPDIEILKQAREIVYGS